MNMAMTKTTTTTTTVAKRKSRITRMSRSTRMSTRSTRSSSSPSSSSWIALTALTLPTILVSLSLLSMTSMSSILLFADASSSPYIISDDRVRSLDITPVLGRGYSIMTDRYHSTCLMVNETTVPSYNYDFTYTDFIGTTTESATAELFTSSAIADSFAYSHVKQKFTPSIYETPVYKKSYTPSKVVIQEHSVVATMRIERYYSSIREEVSPLSDDAEELLSSQDYIGFFKACGPGYVRSIRRAQEVTAIFSFESSSDETARQFASGLRTVSWGKSTPSENHFHKQSKYDGITRSMKIEVKSFGLGLNVDGEDTLYVQSLEEMHDVMNFAFRSMTTTEGSEHVGQVYGIEVIPWVDNPAFQVASRVMDDDIFLPLPRSLIPKAIKQSPSPSSPPSPTASPSPTTELSTFKCRNPTYEIDKFGYCCEDSALFNTTSQEYEYDEEGNGGSADLICRPLRSLDRALVKENLIANGEFVARVDAAVRDKLARISSAEKCMAATRAIPDRYNFHVLKSKDTVEYNAAIEGKFTVAELRMVLDPTGDYGLIPHLAKEFDEFIDMFYHPCLAALFGANIGSHTDTEAKYFMAYPWHTHDECNQLACLVENMRWDRANGGCVQSILTGTGDPGYSGGEDYCSVEMDDFGETLECKYSTDDLAGYHDSAMDCWDELPSELSISYLMDHFCLPDVTGEVVDSTRQTEIEDSMTYCFDGARRRRLVEADADADADTNASSKVTNIRERKHEY